MTQVEQIADFAARASFDDLSENARAQIRLRLLDSIGCALGALGGETVEHVREFAGDLGGSGARSDLDAFYYGALIRYLDFNDGYLAAGETCHPSDNIGAILAAGEKANASGRDLMAAIAVAYQIQCRLCDEAPVRAKGFDHTVQGAYAASAAIGKILGLDRRQLANAIAISATALNALRVTRTGRLSNWKGLAYPHMAADCLRNALLARHGITGPLEVIEGNKGFIESIAGKFEIDWRSEDLERVTRTLLKKYNAEIHSQTSIEAALRLRRESQINPQEIERIDVQIFDVAFNIIGGGEEGNKHVVRTKEEADHSLPYLIAVALLDGEVMPDQYAGHRIAREDVQTLMRKVTVRPDAGYSARFPVEMPARVTIAQRDGRLLRAEAAAYEGSLQVPMSWESARRKFDRLASRSATSEQREQIGDVVAHIEGRSVRRLLGVLTPIIAGIGEPAGVRR